MLLFYGSYLTDVLKKWIFLIKRIINMESKGIYVQDKLALLRNTADTNSRKNCPMNPETEGNQAECTIFKEQ